MIYRCYGLRVQSTHPIPALRPSTSDGAPDIVVRFVRAQQWPERVRNAPRLSRYATNQTPSDDPSGVRIDFVANAKWLHVRYGDGTEFLIDGRGTNVLASWVPPFTIEDACVYLLGPVFGIVLRLRGVTCLHASAVDVGGAAVVIAGPGGAGKSTTAALFADRGHAVLSDDVCVLVDRDGEWLVEPAYPRIGLWPDAVETLFGAADRLPLQTVNWDKRYLDLRSNGYRFQSEPRPLRRIYMLNGRESDSGAPAVSVLAPRDQVARLIENAYVNYVVDDRMRVRDFVTLTRLASQVPVRRLVAHADPSRLPQLREAILRDVDAGDGSDAA
jgi:hypothetical protein